MKQINGENENILMHYPTIALAFVIECIYGTFNGIYRKSHYTE